jgi:hypothetical protein
LCLFAIRKVDQQKTLSGQRKIWFSFQESVFPFGCVCFPESGFGKPLSKLSCVCLSLEKLVNEKYFLVKGKFGLVFRKVFSWKIWAENTFWKL